jgi:hypothetical protein
MRFEKWLVATASSAPDSEAAHLIYRKNLIALGMVDIWFYEVLRAEVVQPNGLRGARGEIDGRRTAQLKTVF